MFLDKLLFLDMFLKENYGKNKVLSNTFQVRLKDFDFPIKFSVSEFTVVCIGTKRIETKVKGYKLSEVKQS